MSQDRDASAAPAAPARVVLAGVIWALALGALTGWIRYYEGLFVLAQGAVCGLLLAWLIARAGRRDGKGPYHPGFRPALTLALLWWGVFMIGQGLGVGLAQPWFDPLGWLGRVWDGKSSEFSFGIAATAGIHRSFSMGAHGVFWLVLNLIDWLIMFFFLLTMPWTHKARPKKSASKQNAGEVEP